MKNRLHEIVKTGIALLSIAVLSACATVEGIGEDVETAGEAVQDAADG